MSNTIVIRTGPDAPGPDDEPGEPDTGRKRGLTRRGARRQEPAAERVADAAADPAAEPAGTAQADDEMDDPDDLYGIEDDDDEEPDGPVGIGDRFRHMLSSGDSSDPLYPRLLRLKHIHPSAWQRAFLVEGMAITGGLVALADKATSWAPLILPVAAAGVVKFHDVLVGLLPPRPTRPADGDDPAAE